MVPWRRLKTYVKGYEFSDKKIGSAFGFDALVEREKVDAHITATLRTQLDDDAYEAVAVARRVGQSETFGTAPFVLVLDDDNLEKLKKRHLPPLHWSIQRIMIVLEGPRIYEPVA